MKTHKESCCSVCVASAKKGRVCFPGYCCHMGILQAGMKEDKRQKEVQ